MRQNNRTKKYTATMLLCVLFCELVYPSISWGLTTGPTQPEVMAFEPVGTTDMVDMFSGSFVYNIPLMDVEGYPVNISYHGGITMEQEASWVGLGWNINPGAINRTVRGVPDDFNGDSVLRDLHIKDEKNLRLGLAAGVEVFSTGDDPPLGDERKSDITVGLGANLNLSNYRGISCDFDINGGINVLGFASAGVNMGVGSQSGASIDYNASGRYGASTLLSNDVSGSAGISASFGGGYSTRSGLKDLNLNFTPSVTSKYTYENVMGSKNYVSGSASFSSSASIPIGVKSFVPVITNSSTMSSIYGRIKFGFDAFGLFGYGNVSAHYSRLKYMNDGSAAAFGYLYLQNAPASNTAVLDFARDKDGSFNKSMQYLPPANMCYDIYSVSGQGTDGTYRPFRNDVGSVYDPVVTSSSTSISGTPEAGIGNVFKAGIDYSHSSTSMSSGPWSDYQRSGTASKGFTFNRPGDIYENVYFKKAGEQTSDLPGYFNYLDSTSTMTPDRAMTLSQKKPGSTTGRVPRSSVLQYHTASADTTRGVGSDPAIYSYATSFAGYASPMLTRISRIGSGNYQRKKDQVSEIVQIQENGKKYVYGIPAMNNIQREVTFSVDPVSSDNAVNLGTGVVQVGSTDATNRNSKGRDNYYNSAITTSYAHSYLLTSVLSNDYMDVTGNGLTDDDLGTFTKFNYTRTDSDYRWVAPFSQNLGTAQYNPNFWSDPKDDKASFVCGSREQWMLHSVETKNYIAEFYISKRADAQGIKAILSNFGSNTFTSLKTDSSLSYKLDSIVLFNKHDRFINTSSATPIKSVMFEYDYSMCTGLPNATAGVGKLTLKKIYTRYGTSARNTISPYQFSYGYNPTYNLSEKDRWGNYKPNGIGLTNYEYPYVDQGDTLTNTYASAWTLNRIVLPSGGEINAVYESNDYSYVQDKAAMEMFKVKGLGNSPSFATSNLLHNTCNSPFLYAYFSRQRSRESSMLSFSQNYMGTNFQPGKDNVIYFNFNVNLTPADNSYEQIKGYANITELGICPNDTSYGFIRFRPVEPKGGNALLHPVAFTAVNTARYNLPQIIYPGSDPDEGDLANILAGMKIAFKDLAGIFKSPAVNLIKRGNGKEVNINKCFIRLQSPGLSKKGGGQRVKTLTFNDNWLKERGNNVSNAIYGKQYDYTIIDPVYGKISSGVASYEPGIGGDENPMRQPVKYTAQSGSNFPPNDPVDLYQETPIGETLFPPPSVGYSSVKVSSIHSEYGRSSQGIDAYEFYTAKDFPAQVIATPLHKKKEQNYYDFFSQEITLQVTQSYTLIFNNMHGKPKKVEHSVYNKSSNTIRPINYQVYNYRQQNGKLNNNVKCLVYNGTQMVVQNRHIAIEQDITLDTRNKTEVTRNSSKSVNLDFFILPLPIPVPISIPVAFTWGSEYKNEFKSATVTKVIQQYGILENVVSYSEGAVTTLQNEIYDPNTGEAVVTSVNNEYQDKEYSTSVPAYWVYKGMGPSYNNIGYRDTGKIVIGAHAIGTLLTTNITPLSVGDELSVFYKDASGVKQHTNAFVMGILSTYTRDSIGRDSVIHDTEAHISSTAIYNHYVCFSSATGTLSVPASHHDSTGIFCCVDPYGTHLAQTRIDDVIGTVALLDSCFQTDGVSTLNLRASVSLTGTRTESGCSPCSSGSGMARSFTYAGSTGSSSTTITIPVSSLAATITLGATILMNQTSGGISTPTLLGNFDFTLYCHYSTVFSHTRYDTAYTYGTHTERLYSYYYRQNCNGLKVLPHFPQNTPGWSVGDTLKSVSIEVINSGQKNMLAEHVQNYTSMDYPVAASGGLNTTLTNLISLNAKTFADSNTAIPRNFIVNPDTVNPFAIGERGMWRALTDFAYMSPRKYAGVTARNSGLFNATSYFTPPTGLPTSCIISPYNYLAPYPYDQNWKKQSTITKWSPNGRELENVNAVGNYSAALFGFNQTLPVAVGVNMRQNEILADGFEDYDQLRYYNDLIPYRYSAFDLFSSLQIYTIYRRPITTSGTPTINTAIAHTGKRSLNTGSGLTVDLPYSSFNYSPYTNYYNGYYSNDPMHPYSFSIRNEHAGFCIEPLKEYIISFWISTGPSPNITDYPIPSTAGVETSIYSLIAFTKTSNIIDGWQQVEAKFTPSPRDFVTVNFPPGFCVDDIRVYPSTGNMKSFVYNPFSQKLMATLDENNFASMYEYDQEGNLVRVKKETAKGIMTVSESRSGNVKKF